MSRYPVTAIFPPVLFNVLNRVIAVALCVTVLCMGLTPPRARADEEARADSAETAQEPAGVSVASHRLRDAIPASSFVAAPPDTAEEDPFFLPEETDKKKLIRDITVFVIVCAFVAFFIVKVFIEKDDDPPPDDDGGKPVPLPE